eukprot:8780674-Alexandrium_andersonii.AAC.1
MECQSDEHRASEDPDASSVAGTSEWLACDAQRSGFSRTTGLRRQRSSGCGSAGHLRGCF